MSRYDLIENQFTMAQQYATNAQKTAESALKTISTMLEDWEFDPISALTTIPTPHVDDIDLESFESPVVKDISPEKVNSVDVSIKTYTPGTFIEPASRAIPPGVPDIYNPSFDGLPGLETKPFSIKLPETAELEKVSFDEITFSEGTPPDSPDLESKTFKQIDIGDIPSFPSIDYPSIPDAPNIELPSAPLLDNISLPEEPELSIPDFEIEVPIFSEDVTIPRIEVNFDDYRSDLLDKIKETISNILTNGGATLSNEVANAVWENAVLRANEDLETKTTELLNFFALRGWEIPPGILQAQLVETFRERARALNEVNNNITARQGELAVTSFHDALRTGVTLETEAMQLFQQMITISLEAQKAAVQAAAEAFNLRVSSYNAQIAGVSALVEAYKAKISGAGAIAGIYETKVRAASLSVQMQGEKVNLFQSMTQAELAKVEVFRLQLQAVSVMGELEKLKADIYRAQIESFAAKVNVNAVLAQVYQAELGGEETKARLYATQVESFKTIEQVKIAQVEALLKKAELLLQNNRVILEKYNFDIERYKAEVAVTSEENRSLALEFQAKAENVKQKNDLELAKVDSSVKKYLGMVQAYSEAVRADSSVIDSKIKAFVAQEQTKVESVKASIEEASGKVKVYLGQVEAERARVEALASSNDANVKKYLGQIQAYSARISAYAEKLKAQALQYEIQVKGITANDELSMTATRANLEILTQRNQVLVEAAKGIAAVASQIAAGALGSVNANASASGSTTEYYDETKGNPTYSHQYIYNTK